MTLPQQFLPLPTAYEMQRWDSESINLGIPEFTLMENAARAALYTLQDLHGSLSNLNILLFMGSGNNGGDAVALARHLLDAGANPLVLHTKKLEDYSGTKAEHLRISISLGIKFIELPRGVAVSKHIIPSPWLKPHIVVDGLLGTGFSKELSDDYINYIKLINSFANSSFIFALDTPSACATLENQIANQTVKAHATICFAAAKPWLVLPRAKQYTGKIFVKNIGIPKAVMENNPPSFRLISPSVVAKLIPPMPTDSHKNTWGHVLVIGGSNGLCGAAHLAAKAALRSGVGLVTVTAPKKLCGEIKAHIADIMTLSFGKSDKWPSSIPKTLLNKIPLFSAIVLGPGLGMEEDTINFVKNILALPTRPRAIIDADAINILAKHTKLIDLIKEHDIMTPHPGEAARLLKVNSTYIQQNRIETIHKLCKLAPCTFILKGAGSLLAQGTGSIGILPYDIPNLAIAGSGDVLSGCVAALAARYKTLNSISVAAIAMCTHAHAGYMTQLKYPMRGNTATDLVELLPRALANILDFPEIYHADI